MFFWILRMDEERSFRPPLLLLLLRSSSATSSHLFLLLLRHTFIHRLSSTDPRPVPYYLMASSALSMLETSAFLGLKLPSSASTRIRTPRPLSATAVRAATTLASNKFTVLKPLGDRVLVKIQAAEEKTTGGILLPSSAVSKPQGGEVVAVGEGRTVGDKKIEVGIQTGKNIVYSKYAGTEIEFNGVGHLLLKEDDIIGVLDTDDIQDLVPLNDRVLIKVAEAEEKTAGGVLLTDSAKEKPVIGTVKAVGPGPIGEDGTRKALEIPVGSSVMYSKYAGTDFKSKDGTQYIVVKASDVLAVLS